MKKVQLAFLLCFTILLLSSIAQANVTMTNNRTWFEALGTIDYNYGFDDFDISAGYADPGNPWTSHGVTYTGQQQYNIIGWSDYYPFFNNGTPMMYNNWWNPVSGNIDATGQYSLFGFDAGYGYLDDNGTVITISTNVKPYSFSVDLNPANNTLFYGFVADSGEYFTSFNINTNEFNAAPGIDNVTLGDNNGQHSVPEPCTMLLLGLGLMGLAGVRRKSKK